tara:strand:+ start:389 stop:505 length:117 start_codon:yes stop_codon:yes gene_type:complete
VVGKGTALNAVAEGAKKLGQKSMRNSLEPNKKKFHDFK